MKTFRWVTKMALLVLAFTGCPIISLAQQNVSVPGDHRDVAGSIRGWVYVQAVASGTLVELSATGTVLRGDDNVTYGPEGASVTLPGRLFPSDMTRFGLVARVTASRTDPLDEIREDWAFGAEPSHCVARGGHLWLAFNDDRPRGNSGDLDVRVTADRNCTERPLPGPAPESVIGDLEITGLEVTQAVQSYPDNSIPLIGYKRTLVRVFVRGVSGSRGAWNDVTGRLTVRNISGNYGGQSIPERELLPITGDPRLAITVPVNNDSRGRWQDSLNFLLEPDQTAPGVREFRVAVTSISNRAETDTANNTLSRQLTFERSINVSVWGARYRTSLTPEAPRNSFSEAVDYTSSAFPVSSFNIRPWPGHSYDRPTPLRFNSDPPGRSGSRTALQKMSDWSFDALDNTYRSVNVNAPSLAQIMAVITPEGSADGNQGLMFGSGPYSVTFAANTAVVGANMAHEIGHGYGRPDVEADRNYPRSDLSIGGHVGVRFGFRSGTDLTLQAGRRADGQPRLFDFMSAANPSWTSPYTYCALLETFSNSQVRCPNATRRAARPSDVPEVLALFNHARQKPKPQTANAGDQLWLYVGGWVMPDGTIDLRPFATISGAAPTPPKGKAYRATLETADGQVLRETTFDLMEVLDNKQPVARPFRFFMPFDVGAALITFRRTGEDKVVTERRVSANAPEVGIIDLQDGQILKGLTKLRWRGSDGDGDQLTYALDYSTDGGSTWARLQSDITDETTELDADALPGSDDARLRVRATDGVWSGDAIATVRVARKQPQITIESSSMSGGATPDILEGKGFDYEDGPLTGPSQVRWSSNRDGDLGTGPRLVVSKLTPGTHTLTAVVRDSEGNEASATTTIKLPERNVGKRQPSPLNDKPIPADKPVPADKPTRNFMVTDAVLKADEAKLVGQCPLTVRFTGYITANGPGTVKYTFTRSDGATAPVFTVDFKEAGTKTVTSTWTLSRNYDGWQAIKILSPNETESSHDTGAFAVACATENQQQDTNQTLQQPDEGKSAVQVTAVSLKADDAKVVGPCPLTVNFSGSITTNGAVKVKYTFLRSDGATAPTYTLEFEESGTQTVTTTWTLGGDELNEYKGWQMLKILSPNAMESSREAGSFLIVCGK